GSGTLAQKLLKHQQAEAPALARARPGLPDALEPLVQRMLAKRPEDRFSTPAEVARALEPFAPKKPATAIVSGGPVRATTLRPEGKRRRLILAGVALVLAGVVLAWLAFPAASGRPGSTV